MSTVDKNGDPPAVGPVILPPKHGNSCTGYTHGASVSDVYDDPNWWEILVWTVGGTCVLVSVAIFIVHASRHVRYAERKYRKTFVLLLSIVPVFAITAGLAIFLIRGAELMNFFRHVWEAVILYAFWGMVRHFCGSWEIAEELAKDHKVHRLFTFCCLPKMRLTKVKLELFGYGVLQFALVNILLQFLGAYLTVYCVVSPTGESSYILVSLMRLLSLVVAMYCLTAMANVIAKILPTHRIHLKFWGIKAALMVTFIQGFILSRLAKSEVITGAGPYDAAELVMFIYNALVCVEMVPLAVLLTYAYPIKDHKFTASVREKTIASQLGFPTMDAASVDELGGVDTGGSGGGDGGGSDDGIEMDPFGASSEEMSEI
eukprot:TRINITY_DN1118_c0_g1_i1.p1 TRINITY_DN1118_c0_g1~~TRINITY_DN1118_c0_g1_i1.p1  ORF type:complete len:373 (-),score=64.35 TRINITY_DN1118_c0_g1_i1:38-1156(-)